MNRAEYQKYLASDHWKQTRLKRMIIDKRRCWCCDKNADHVHHITYRRLGREEMSDLIAVCQKCHSAIHHINKKQGTRLDKIHKLLREALHPKAEGDKRTKVKKRKLRSPRPARDPQARTLSNAKRKAGHRCGLCQSSGELVLKHGAAVCKPCGSIVDQVEASGRYKRNETFSKARLIANLSAANRKTVLANLGPIQQEGSIPDSD